MHAGVHQNGNHEVMQCATFSSQKHRAFPPILDSYIRIYGEMAQPLTIYPPQLCLLNFS